MMLGPVSSENAGAGSGIGCVRAFSLVIRACWCWRGGVVSAVRARGLPGGWPYLQQTHPHILEQVWTPPGYTAQTTPPHQHQHAQVTGESARTLPVPEPAPSFSLLAGPSILSPPPKPRALRRLPQPSPPPLTPQPPPPQPPHPPPPPRPQPALHPASHGVNLPNRPPKPVPTASNPAAARPTPRRGPHPQPSRNPRPPPNSHPNPSARHDCNSQPSPNPSPSPAPRQQREPDPPRTSSMTFGPSRPRPGGSSTKHGAPRCHRRRRDHLHGGARRGRSTTHLVPPPLKTRTPGPLTTPDQTRSTPRSTSSVPAPLPTLDVSPHTAHAPLPPPPRVPTQPRGG